MIFHNVNKKIKISFLSVFFIAIFVPCVVFGQHYIIENIPDTGDDGLRADIQTPPSTDGSQIIDDTITVTTTTTKTTTAITTVEEFVVNNKTGFQFLSALGTVTGVIIAAATTAVPLFATTPTMMHDLILLNLFGMFVKKKNEKRWGVVFDFDTKRPIPAVKIVLFDNKMKELETTYSDRDGRFGFLAGEGTYRIDVYKKDYKLYKEQPNDPLYGEVYNGGELYVRDDKVLRINVAMRSTTIDWKDFADKKIAEYTSTWSLVKKYLFTTLYFIGLIATIIVTIFYPSTFNIILVTINTILFIYIYFFKKKDHGTVTTPEKRPVPFAVVNLYDESGAKNAFAVTDVVGRYYMLAENGQYTMRALGQPVGGEQKEVQHDVHVREGIVSKDIVFK